MPTRFYIPYSTGPAGAVTPPVTASTWAAGSNSVKPLPTSPTNTALNSRTQTFSGALPVLHSVNVSDALPYAKTLSGTVTLRQRAYKTSSSGTYTAATALIVRVVSNDGQTSRGEALPFSTGTLTTGTTNTPEFVFNLTPIQVQAGDRVYIEIGTYFTGTQQAQGSRIYFGDPSADSDIPGGERPWIEFSTDLFTAPPAPPSPPTALVHTFSTPVSVGAQWTAPVSGNAPTSYEYSVDGGAPVSVGLDTSAILLDFTPPGTTKAVRVRAVNANGASAWAGPVNMTSLPITPPTGLTAVPAGPYSVSLLWSAPSFISSPSYEYRLNGGAPVAAGNGLTWLVEGLSPNTTYSVQMRTYASGYYSNWTSAVNVTTTEVPEPPAPVVRPSGCFAPVRGSALRVTALDARGAVPDLVEYVTSKSVIKATVSEVVETGGTEVLKNPEEKRRLRLTKNAQVIRHKVDIEFLRVDPEMLRLVAGVELVYSSVPGFGDVPFGVSPFGGGEYGDVIGFDSGTTLRATSFALEVWSKLDGGSALPEPVGFDTLGFDEEPFDGYYGCDARRWGYTLFPFLRGGRLSGFTFADGLVSFNLRGAQTRRNPGWGVGPHDLTGPFERLETPVSRNTSWRMFITNSAPPAEECGIQYRSPDVLDNGTPANPMPDPAALFAVDAGGPDTSSWIIDGGTP